MRRGMSPKHLPSPILVWPCPCPLLSFPASFPPLLQAPQLP